MHVHVHVHVHVHLHLHLHLHLHVHVHVHCVYTAQAATGISDVDELVTTFINAEVREYVSISTRR